MHCWSRYLLWLTIAVLGTGNLLLACGQKGPLTLPDKPAASQQVTTTAIPTFVRRPMPPVYRKAAIDRRGSPPAR